LLSLSLFEAMTPINDHDFVNVLFYHRRGDLSTICAISIEWVSAVQTSLYLLP
jgi:hypothetical protein